MKRQRGELEIVGIILLAFVAAFILGGLESASCHSSWGRSGMETSWGPLQGCLVKLPDGRWWPTESLHEININQLTAQPIKPPEKQGDK